MQLDRIENGFQIDAAALGPLLGVPTEDVQRLMREGRIASLCEEGQGEDRGRHRITFRHGAVRVRLTVNDAGHVLLRTRNAVAPRLEPQSPVAPTAIREQEPGPETDDKTDDLPVDLTREIENRFHLRHRQRLEELKKLAEMVEDLHEWDEGVPAGLHQLLGRIEGVLEPHMQVAESVVFPAIRRGVTADLEPWIEALRRDYELLRNDCTRIREISRDFQLPDAACTSWATLYGGLFEFISALTEHIRLENDVLFQQLEPERLADG